MTETDNSVFSKIPENQHLPDKGLEELDVEVFQLDGWELLVLLVKNREAIIQDGGVWFSACQLGQSRSAQMNRLLVEIGFPAAVKLPSLSDTSEDGVSHFALCTRIADGEADGDIIEPSNFKQGFNRLIVFLRSNDFNTDRIRSLYTKSLRALSKKLKSQNFSGFKMFVVLEDESEMGDMMNIVKNGLAQNKSSEKVCQEIESRFNPLHGLR